jgi:NDP-sugar pyrophosphorylase family protein
MDRERVTITLDPDLLKRVDSLVDGVAARNRSDAIEQMMRKCMGSSVNTAFICAGGKGERLMPLTKDVPKPMVRVNNKPILEHVARWLKGNGVNDFVFGLGYKAEAIKDYFKDGSKLGVKIHYSEEREPLGDAGCISLAKDRLTNTFIVANGDILTNFDVRSMIDTHIANKATITVALKSVPDPSRFGVAELDGQKITGFVEKPGPGKAPTNLINAGVYVMEPKVFEFIKGQCGIARQLIPRVLEDGGVYGYPFSGPWIDIGVMDSLEKAREIW